MLIIAFGIMAIVGTLTAVEALKGSLTESFSSLGANTFNIRNRSTNMGFGKRTNGRFVPEWKIQLSLEPRDHGARHPIWSMTAFRRESILEADADSAAPAGRGCVVQAYTSKCGGLQKAIARRRGAAL